MAGSLLLRVLQGIGGWVRRSLLSLAAAAAILAVAALVVLPLWYLSSRSPRLYTVAALALAGALVLALLGRRVVAGVRRAGGPAPFLRRRLLPAMGRTGIVLAALVLLYGILLLFGHGYPAVAVPLAVAYLFGLAALRYGRRRRK